MELSDKEKKFLELIQQNPGDEKFDEAKLDQLIQASLAENNLQREELKKEIETAENINRLCNLNLQTLIIQYMQKKQNQNNTYARILSLWSSSVLPEWIKLAENIQKELGHNDIKKMNNEELENNLANLVRSTAEQLYNSENENSRKFSIKEITTILRKSGEGQDKNSKESEDIMVVRVDQSGADQLNKVDNALIEKYIQLSESIQNKIQEIVIVDATDTKGDTNAMYSLSNLKYLVLPKEQFEESYYKFKERRLQAKSNKIKEAYSNTNLFLSDFESLLKDLSSDFSEDCQKMNFSHEHLLALTQNIFEKYHSSSIQKSLQKINMQLTLSDLFKILDILYNYYEGFLNTVSEALEPDEEEEKFIQNYVGTALGNNFEVINPKAFACLDSQSQTYLTEVASRLKQNLQAKIKFQDANLSIQSDSQLKNIDLDWKASNFLEEYNLTENIAENMEQNNKLVLNRLEESFYNRTFSENFDEKNPLIFRNQGSSPQRAASELSKLIKPTGAKSANSPQANKPKTEPVPFKELINYAPNMSIPLTDNIKSPEYLANLLSSENRIPELELFSNLLPLRISSVLLKFVNHLDSFAEILFKFQKLVGEGKNLVQRLVSFLITLTENLQEKVKEYTELDHPDAILYFCDWNFLNYRVAQYIASVNLLSSTSKIFESEFLSEFRKKFAQTSNFDLNYIKKQHLNNFYLIVLPAINGEEWQSFRPFTSSEIPEDDLRTKVAKVGKAPADTRSLYIKNVNYGLRMWKIMLQSRLDEVQTFWDLSSVNIYAVKIISSLLTESISGIFMTYKATKPSRIRNPQYLNDLKFLLDVAFQYLKIILGITLVQINKEGEQNKKILNNVKFFLTGTINTLWLLVKSIRSQVILLETNPQTLAAFLKDCANNEINLPSSSQDYIETITQISEQLKYEASTIIPEAYQDQSQENMLNFNSLRETSMTKTGNSIFFISLQKRLENMLEILVMLTETRKRTPLADLCEIFDSKMEALSRSDLSKPKNIILDTSQVIRVPTVEKKTVGKRDEFDDSVGLEGEVKELLKPIKNPLLKYGRSLFLHETPKLKDKLQKENLSNILLTPEHIVYLIKKRLEYTFDDYPLLTEENKQAQKVINKSLEEFCAKFKLNMIEVPST